MVGICVAIRGVNFAVKLCFETMNRQVRHHIPQMFSISMGTPLKRICSSRSKFFKELTPCQTRVKTGSHLYPSQDW